MVPFGSSSGSPSTRIGMLACAQRSAIRLLAEAGRLNRNTVAICPGKSRAAAPDPFNSQIPNKKPPGWVVFVWSW